jgi:hypothetical protein
VPAGDDPLGEQAATRLEVGDQVPATEGVGGEVTGGVEQAEPVAMYFSTYRRVSGFSRSAIDGDVSTAPPAMSWRWRTMRPNSAAPWYLAALVNSSSG